MPHSKRSFPLPFRWFFIGRKHRMIAGREAESSSIGWSIS
jgi:hypothetical protein